MAPSTSLPGPGRVPAAKSNFLSVIKPPSGASESYLSTLSQFQDSMTKGDFNQAAKFVRQNLTYLPDWMKETKRSFGSFVMQNIPTFHQGAIVLAVVRDRDGLAEMQKIVTSVPDLKPWVEMVERHQGELELFDSILKCIAENPGCKQSGVKELVNGKDGQQIGLLVSYLDKAGKIKRVRAGRTFSLFMANSAGAAEPLPKRSVESHRKERTPPRYGEIDFNKIAYVPLPRSPLRWQEKQVIRERAKTHEPKEPFEVRDAEWTVANTETIAPADRPDPAFRKLYATDAGLLMIDDLGNAEGMGQVAAAAISCDRHGEFYAKKGLMHDVYRLGVNPCGRSLVALSRECVVHAYDEKLEPIFETALNGTPEIQAIRKRFDISDDQLKNHIRCVALSRDTTHYLFTVVDEAWCIDTKGKGRWGAKLPIKEGWAKVTSPSAQYGTSGDVDNALALMKISLPFTPEDLKKRYRELSKQWHPDLHPENPDAKKQMQELNAAAEILTGIDPSALPRYTGAVYQKDFQKTEINAGGLKFTVSMGMQMGELQAADWIYAASFAAKSDMSYLAGYSGKIVLVDENGEGVRAYDIGCVPCRIVDTSDYLYLLTDTRLYVLRNDALHALIDTFDGGDLVVAQTGFGLLERNRFRWFREDGKYLGSVVSKEPLRRVYSIEGGIAVETRQKRAVIQGVQNWWE
jgi:hypothetical protein